MTAPAHLIDVNGIAPSGASAAGASRAPIPPPFVAPEDLALTAHHESGHVVVAHYLGGSVTSATVARDVAAREAGRVYWRAASDARDQRVSTLLVAAAGCAAEQMAGGRIRGRGDADLAMSESAAESLADELGVTLATIRAGADYECKRILNNPRVWRAVEGVAAALVARGTLMREEVDHLIRDAMEAST